MIPVTSFKDFYKADHRRQYPDGTVLVYSNFTPRKSRTNFKYVVVFAIQAFIKKFLIEEYNRTFFEQPKEIAVSRYKRRLDNALGKDAVPVEHIAALWDLAYLPIEIKALDEGTLCPMGVPILTIKNTKPEFYWLPNDLETLLSCELWQPITSATTAFQYYKLLTHWAKVTGAPLEFVKWQGHDFSMRGMPGVEAAMASGAGHLLSFFGTDTMCAIDWLEEYYGANSDKEMVGGSVYATEHSVMCMGTQDNEIGTFERLLFELYPNAPILSVVSDTWSLSRVVTEFLPILKERILQRPGKLVIRPDSGDPVRIICGYMDNEVEVDEETGLIYPLEWSDLYEENVPAEKPITPFYKKGLIQALWELFGGGYNEKGYKVLDPHIGAIYGDSITLQRADEICKRLEKMKFASSNIVFGIGSYTYQYVTRDTFGFAMKATYGEVEATAEDDMSSQGGPYLGQKFIDCREIQKSPETDDGTKKSAKGLLQVAEEDGSIVLHDQRNWDEEDEGLLTQVFLNGRLTKETTLQQIREKLTTYI